MADFATETDGVDIHFPDLGGATAWLNSPPLTPDDLRGRVVVVQFCTFSCINWLRTVPYVKAWADRYRDAGLVVLGVHSPEFPFEHDLEKIRTALAGMGIDHPIAVDNAFAVWRAFDNAYWPALYFHDANGQRRHHHFGEEDYERSERVIQRLLAEAGHVVDEDLVSLDPVGVALGADWEQLQSPETYVGYARATGFASSSGFRRDRPHVYTAPTRLSLNGWALSGDWGVGPQIATLNEPGGRILHRFHGRDANLVLGAQTAGVPVPFRVRVDGAPPGRGKGLDVDEQGAGTVVEERLYQLIRQDGRITDRTLEITFLDAGAQAYVFTFG